MIEGHRYISSYSGGYYRVSNWNPAYERYEEIAVFNDSHHAREYVDAMNVRERV